MLDSVCQSVPGCLILDDTVDGVVADDVLAGQLVIRHTGVLKPVAPDNVLPVVTNYLLIIILRVITT